MQRLVGSLVCVLVLVLAAAPASAEREFEFIKALVENGDIELAELQLSLLEREGEHSDIVILGRAYIKMTQADRAGSADERQQLYAEALEGFNSFVQRSPGSPYSATAYQYIGDIELERIKVLLESIKENPDMAADKKADLRRQAQEGFDKILTPLKEAAEKSWQEFITAWEPHRDKSLSADTQVQNLPYFDEWQKAVTAEQSYIKKAFQKEEAYEAGSMAHKEWLKQLLEHLEQKNVDYLQVQISLGAQLFMKYFMGKVYVKLEDYENAKRKGYGFITAQNFNNSYVKMMKGWAWRDLIEMYVKAGQKAQGSERTKYLKQAVSTGRSQLMELRQLMSSPGGNAVNWGQIERARAHLLLDEYEEALETLQPVVEDCPEPWLVEQATLLMLEVIQAGPGTTNDPRILFEAGEGAMLQFHNAKRANEPQSALHDHLESALQHYHYAGIIASDPDVPLKTRLKVEARSWFQSGLAYYHMHLFNEAMLCFEAVIQKYGPVPELVLRKDTPEDLEKYVEDRGMEGTAREQFVKLIKQLRERTQYHSEVEAIDKLVKKAANNLRTVASLQRRKTGHPHDIRLYKEKLMQVFKANPDMVADADFWLAQAVREEGQGMFERMHDFGRALRIEREQERSNPSAVKRYSDRVDQLAQNALDSYLEAAERYGKTPETSRFRETSIFTSGHMFYQAMNVCRKAAQFLGGEQGKVWEQRMPDFGRKCLDAWEAYRERIDKNPTVDTKRQVERAKFERDVMYAAPTVANLIEDFDLTFKLIEKYEHWYQKASAEWKTKNGELWSEFVAKDEKMAPERAQKLRWLRFKALRQIALDAMEEAENLAQLAEAAKTMTEAQELAKVWKVKPEFVTRYYAHAARYMGAGWNQFANKVKPWANETTAKIQEAKQEGKDEAAEALNDQLETYKTAIDEYNGASARALKELIELDDPNVSDIDFMASIGERLFKLEDWENTQYVFRALLERHDPEGDIVNKPLNRPTFEDWAQKIDLDNWEVKQDLKRRVGVVIPNHLFDDKTEGDDEPMDYDRGIAEIRKVLKIADKLPEVHGEKQKIGCRWELEEVALPEFEHRLKILDAHDRISQCYMMLAEDAEEAGEQRWAEAKKLWDEAAQSFAKLKEYWKADPDVQYNLARCYNRSGLLALKLDKKDEALEKLRKARTTYLRTSDYGDKDSPESESLRQIWWDCWIGARKAEVALAENGGWIEVQEGEAKKKVTGKQLADLAARFVFREHTTNASILRDYWADYAVWLERLIAVNDQISVPPTYEEQREELIRQVNDMQIAQAMAVAEKEKVYQYVLSADMLILQKETGRTIGYENVKQEMAKLLKEEPDIAKERRKRYKARLLASLGLRDLAGEQVDWEALHPEIKDMIEYAGLTEATARGLLAQGRIRQRLLEAHSDFLRENEVKKTSTNFDKLMSYVDLAVKQQIVTAEELEAAVTPKIQQVMTDPDLAIYEYDELPEDIRNNLKAAGFDKDTVTKWMAQGKMIAGLLKKRDEGTPPEQMQALLRELLPSKKYGVSTMADLKGCKRLTNLVLEMGLALSDLQSEFSIPSQSGDNQ